jgi:hypothetical protein
MAEERTLGLARANEDAFEEPSKEELQRRMDQARDSISNTVTEIKETVANQVQAVKETLDWREQFKKRPVAWSVGAAGVGFMFGYGLAAAVKGDQRDEDLEFYSSQIRSYAAQPILSAPAAPAKADQPNGNGHEGPGIIERLTHTPVYGRVRDEVGNIGDALVNELGKTAKQFVLPALMTSLKHFIGGYLPESSEAKSKAGAIDEETRSRTENASSYQPALDRGPR